MTCLSPLNFLHDLLPFPVYFSNRSDILSHTNYCNPPVLGPFLRPWRDQFRTRLNSDTPAFCTMNVLKFLVWMKRPRK